MSRSPRILAIDCATVPASVATLAADGSTRQVVHRDERRADAWVGTAVRECLDGLGLDLEAIQGFAACIGPGTFTGIRVGIATALGLAAPRDLPVCGVRSVDALALLGTERGAAAIAACIDARRSQVYAALFEAIDGAEEPPLAPTWGPVVCAPDELEARTREYPRGTLPIGSGSAEHSEEPLAAAICLLAARGWSAAGPPPNWPAPEPLYLRPPDARPPRNPLREARRRRLFEQP